MTIQQIQSFLKITEIFVVFGITCFLNPEFYNQSFLRNSYEVINSENSLCLKETLIGLASILKNKFFFAELSDVILIEFFSGCLSLLAKKENVQEMFNEICDLIPGNKVFKFVMLLNRNLPIETSKLLNKQLHQQLKKPNGLKSLCCLLLEQKSDEQPSWKKCEIISNIVGAKGYEKEFYLFIIEEIFVLIQSENKFIEAAVASLTKIYSLPYKSLKLRIEEKLFLELNLIINPSDLLTGYVLMDLKDFFNSLKNLNKVFCSSFAVSLKSELLIEYLPILFRIFGISENDEIRKIILPLIIQCLSNRADEELKIIIENLLFDEKPINKRFGIKDSIIVIPEEEIIVLDTSQVLSEILKNSNHNILIYSCFINLLKILEKNSTFVTKNSDLIDEEDVIEFHSKLIRKRFLIITTLTDLINYKNFHSQFNENPHQILNFLKELLMKDETDEEIAILVLSIFKEFIEKIQNETDLLKTLKEFRLKTKNKILLKQIDLVMNENRLNEEISPYKFALQLCSEAEPHLQVYGICELKKLLENKNEECLANQNQILALSLIYLKEDDSFVYHNCIRLILSLSKIMESYVLETLIAEYQMIDSLIDYRMKIGEVIVKITEGMGPISYKYKDMLIGCFLIGCRSSENDLRTSSFSNLGSVCRILVYQVHGFFNEVSFFILLFFILFRILEYFSLGFYRPNGIILSKVDLGLSQLTNFIFCMTNLSV